MGEKTSWLVGLSQADDGAEGTAAVPAVVGVGAVDAAEQVAGSLGTDAVAATGDSSQFTWGLYHELGSGLALYYEGASVTSENKDWDGLVHLLGMRVNF